MSTSWGPERWANELTLMLDLVYAGDRAPARYPVDVEGLLREISHTRFPADPLIEVKGSVLPKFEGALIPVGDPLRGWAILYNTGVSEGRKRFTLAHEAGHYFLHRHLMPGGVYCDERSISRRSGVGIEKEADTFAATLLMPFHDMRARIPPKAKPSLDDLAACADRYGVSLSAVILRWLEYTDTRAMIVVSTEGFALWSRSSLAALRSGRFIRTSGAPYELPAGSCVGQSDFSAEARAGIRHEAGVWFGEPVEEQTISAKLYDQAITLLHFDLVASRAYAEEDAVEPDVVDRMNGLGDARGN